MTMGSLSSQDVSSLTPIKIKGRRHRPVPSLRLSEARIVSVTKIAIIENDSEDGERLERLIREIPVETFLVERISVSQLNHQFLREFNPQLLVLTWPKKDGLAQVVALQKTYGDLPLVVIGHCDHPNTAVQVVREGSQDYLPWPDVTSHLLARAFRYAIERHHIDQTLLQRAEGERLVIQIMEHIHESLDLPTILQTTVDEVRQLLRADRVLVYRFLPDWRGVMEVESVLDPWPSALGDVVGDSCFIESFVEKYRQGRIQTITDIHAQAMHPCHRDLLAHYQVRANLVVPIVPEGKLWGLLLAHQCDQPREWQEWEVDLMRQLSTQVAIAIQQAELYEKARKELHDRKAAEAELLYQARHDPLTHLPNRWLFEERVNDAIRLGANKPDYCYAVLCLDLDRFKNLNDSLGHAIGDLFLQEIAERLQRALSPQDLVARLGGDEFVVLLDDIADFDQAKTIAEHLRKRLARPFEVNQYALHSTASIGLVMGNASYSDAADLLRDADTAMYRAKTKGKNRCEVFDSAMYAQVRDRLQMELELWQALERAEFELAYQPIVSLRSQKLQGFEALIRWPRDGKPNISPQDFIPIAEETGLILGISHWVLQSACEQLQEWLQAYPALADAGVTMNVNLSGRHFSQVDIVEQIQTILTVNKLPGESLKIEITESALMENLEMGQSILLQLKAMGVKIAIDDFGTGYSSLSYLRSLPLDCIKIDRSFITQMDSSREDLEVVHTILALAENLKLDTIAEGIENLAQLKQLRSLRCPFGQGYFLSPPLTAHEMDRFIHQHLSDSSLN
ncbi:EAL domain-containing protein [Candidatus Synechococcus calcipolaris G9]|uniref:EAL domain-containing protein n=1 Tax=Candidatus Synechococcus calcipolaris G9 TaxID=1497997 RepID=A0ABT6EVV7_9SYNE|nr:EAL domain-containing protein [Candidatus Synechococcus calcipolaris]MDG2989921.1 EAL domain-containing protein [Candidatus Synechococcus calcipolaris G9]